MNKFFHKILSSGYTTGFIITVSLVLYYILGQLGIINLKLWEDKYNISFKEIIPILMIALLYLLHFLFQGYEKIKNIMSTRSSHYTDVNYKWKISAEGDFEARNIYSFKNGSKNDMKKLPTEGFIWFDNPDKEDTKFRIIPDKDRRQHKFKDEKPKINSFLDKFLLAYNPKNIYSLNWAPEVIPPLAPKEEITYSVEIFTPKTENDAFTDKGTHMGFPITVKTNMVTLVCEAPQGYKFHFNNPAYLVVDMQGVNDYPDIKKNIPAPILSADECVVTWTIKNPKLEKRYWINYKLVKINYTDIIEEK